MVLVRDSKKQEELTSILRDGGALVRPWHLKDLFTRTPTEMANLVIYNNSLNEVCCKLLFEEH